MALNRQTRICWITSLALIAIAGLLHENILRAIATILISSQPPNQAHVIAINNEHGDRRYNVAAGEIFGGNSTKVLLFSGEEQRLQKLGIVLPAEVISSQELRRAGVDDSAIHILPGQHHDEFDMARSLDSWLQHNPAETVAVYWDRFNSRRLRIICDRVLDVERRGRLVVVGLPNRRYDETNWWTSRGGLKAFFGSWYYLSYCFLVGENERPEIHWDAEFYEASVLP